MPLRTSILGTIISIIIGILITLGVSQNSIDFYGVPLLVVCFVYSYIIHWIFFVHGYLFQTEHYFDAIGSFTFVSLSFFLIFTVQDFYAFLFCSFFVIWFLRLVYFFFINLMKYSSTNSRHKCCYWNKN